MTTWIVVLAFLGMFVGSGVVWGVCLHLGLQWANVSGYTLRRVAWVSVLGVMIGAATSVASHLIPTGGPVPDPRHPNPGIDVQGALLMPLGLLALHVLLIVILIRWAFSTSLWRAFRAWLATLLSAIVTVVFLVFVFRPLLVETFRNEGNSMAPTLLGEHWTAPCETCGSPAYCSPDPPPQGRFAIENRELPSMICRDHFHITEPKSLPKDVGTPDRIFAAKYLSPRRWDLVTFRFPEQPELTYVKRLVGLPGEEIVIRDGKVWANGQPLTPPAELREIQYLDHVPGPLMMQAEWGTAQSPAKLGPDEYFVLGDFSAASMDSRIWQTGAPGHPPYAVPASHIVGVVTHIYWPPARWRVFR